MKGGHFILEVYLGHCISLCKVFSPTDKNHRIASKNHETENCKKGLFKRPILRNIFSTALFGRTVFALISMIFFIGSETLQSNERNTWFLHNSILETQLRIPLFKINFHSFRVFVHWNNHAVTIGVVSSDMSFSQGNWQFSCINIHNINVDATSIKFLLTLCPNNTYKNKFFLKAITPPNQNKYEGHT